MLDFISSSLAFLLISQLLELAAAQVVIPNNRTFDAISDSDDETGLPLDTEQGALVFVGIALAIAAVIFGVKHCAEHDARQCSGAVVARDAVSGCFRV